jgi:tRNA(adenine34) deaminase
MTALNDLDPALPGEDRPLARPGGATGVRLAPPRPGDRMWMARALEQARAAALAGEVPVGAVLVGDGRLLAEGFNRTVMRPDPTAHAEVEVLRAGALRRGDWRLDGCTLYVTLEPCAQCAGAVVLARVDRLVYAAADPKAGMAGSLGNLVQDARLNHRMEVTAGVLAAEGGELLRAFFRSRRRQGRGGEAESPVIMDLRGEMPGEDEA